jgi:3-isopropylmalate/(R)-2-methylmalate dehydratase large subunit
MGVEVVMLARVRAEAEASGKRVADGVKFFIQFGSREVEAYAKAKGYIELFQRTGVEVIKPGCGACIGCGPGVSDKGDQVSVSAINRNYKGRSGPGKLYLASPLTVAASAVRGEIVEYETGMFGSPKK